MGGFPYYNRIQRKVSTVFATSTGGPGFFHVDGRNPIFEPVGSVHWSRPQRKDRTGLLLTSGELMKLGGHTVDGRNPFRTSW